MSHTMNSSQSGAARRYRLPGAVFAVTLAVLLGACGSAPQTQVKVFDFGPGMMQPPPVPTSGAANLPDLVLAEVEAAPALDGNALLYRLAYAEPLQLRPYAQARWSMSPSLLFRQQVRSTLGQRRAVLTAGDAGASRALVLRLELEEFSQVFDSAERSQGVVRIRATLSQAGAGAAAKTLAQTSLQVQQPSVSADAAGGAQALVRASAALIGQLDRWVAQNTPAP